ncbi:MAG: polysaccharide pyruvyl transferase CsaB [Synergistes sp.]|nr:polysaccharide pyruvyl transferase CsaB [Synergistes sp.]
MRKRFDALIAGYYGFNNFGDELLAQASIDLLEKSGIERAHVAILSAAPKESEIKFGAAAFDRWKLSSVVKAMSASKMLILGGGGLFQDTTSVRSCVYYFALIKIAKILGLKIFAASQSVGPLNGKTARFMTRSAFALCSAVTVRDEESLRLLKELKINAELSQDLAFDFASDLQRADNNKIYLNFNARPHYEELAASAAAAAMLYANENDLKVRGIAFSDEDEREMLRLQNKVGIKFDAVYTVKTLADFAKVTEYSAASFGMRLHFTELSYMSGIPVCGCVYDPKVSGFCQRYGISVFEPSSPLKFSAADVASLESEELKTKFCDVVSFLRKI